MSGSHDLLGIARDARDCNLPEFVRWLSERFKEYPSGQSEARFDLAIEPWFWGRFISDFLSAPPLHVDRRLDGRTGDRPVGARLQLDQTTVHIDKLSWDHLTIALPVEPPNLRHWFDKWFVRPRPFELDGIRLSGCVHSLNIGEHLSSTARIEIDLGTARAEAFVDLIETFGRAGIEKLVVSPVGEVNWDQR